MANATGSGFQFGGCQVRSSKGTGKGWWGEGLWGVLAGQAIVGGGNINNLQPDGSPSRDL